MIILNGVKYRLTIRGKIAAGILLAVVILCVIMFNSSRHKDVESQSSLKQQPVTAVSNKSTSKASGTKLTTPKVKSVGVEPKAFSILFGPDSTALEPEYEGSLSLVAEYLKSTPTAEVVVEGNFNAYPDLKGEYFESLSMDRAMNVAGYLKQIQDVPEKQIMVINLGGKRQFNKDASKAELAKNRRVDISIRAIKQD